MVVTHRSLFCSCSSRPKALNSNARATQRYCCALLPFYCSPNISTRKAFCPRWLPCQPLLRLDMHFAYLEIRKTQSPARPKSNSSANYYCKVHPSRRCYSWFSHVCPDHYGLYPKMPWQPRDYLTPWTLGPSQTLFNRPPSPFALILMNHRHRMPYATGVGRF